MKKNIIIAVLSLIIICGIIVIGTAQILSNTEDIIADAIAATENLKNFEAELTAYTSTKRENGDVTETSVESDLIYFSDPYKMYINMMILDDEDSTNNLFERYAVYDGQMFTVYTYDSMDSMSEKWNINHRFSKEQFSLHGRENTIKEDIVFYLKNADKFTKNKDEKIKDYDTAKYTGTFTGYSLRNLYRQMGYADSLIDIIIDRHKNFNIEIWIDKKSNNVVKYSMDTSHIYDYIFEQQFADGIVPEKISWEKYLNEVIIFNFNNAPEFEIPKEALDGEWQFQVP